MAKTPEEKLTKAASKGIGTVRTMLQRSVEAREAFDDAIVGGRIADEALASAQVGLIALRGCLVRLGNLLAELESTPEPDKQAGIFVANQSIGEEVGSAMDLVSALPLPPAAERSSQILVLKAKKGEWAEVSVPMDQDELAEALLSQEWRQKAARAVTGTRSRLVNIQDKGGVKELEQALNRIEEAIRVEDEAETIREKTNRLEAALSMRRKWVELGFFQQMENYLAADAESLGMASRGVAALGAVAGGSELQGKATEALDRWRKRHAIERKSVRFALLGSVYDYTVCQQSLDPEGDYPKQLQALLNSIAP